MDAVATATTSWRSALVDGTRVCVEEPLVALDDAELAADLQLLSSVARRVEVQRARIVAEQLRRQPKLADSLTRTLKRTLGCSGGAAKALGDTAVALSVLPACGTAAVTEGAMSAEHVRAMSGTSDLPESVRAELVEAAAAEDPDAFRRRVERVLQEHDRGDGKKRAQRQDAARGASWRECDDGMHELRARLSAEDGSIVRTALQRVMDEIWRAQHPGREPERVERDPHGQRLADALVGLARRSLAPKNANGANPAVPLLLVLVDYQTLVDGLHERSVCQDEWGTPLSPATVRRLACDADIIPIVLGGDGVPLDMGRRRRLPTPSQRLAVIARDRHCTEPGCTMPPAYCQVHHHKDWIKGGPTDLANLRLLCHQHHRQAHGRDGNQNACGDDDRPP